MNAITFDLTDDVFCVNTFCKTVEEAEDCFSELTDILTTKGHVSIADWHEWEDPDYYENFSEADRLLDKQLGWMTIKSFSILKGAGLRPHGLKEYYYIYAEQPMSLDNHDEAIDELIEEKESKIRNLQREIERLKEKKKGA